MHAAAASRLAEWPEPAIVVGAWLDLAHVRRYAEALDVSDRLDLYFGRE